MQVYFFEFFWSFNILIPDLFIYTPNMSSYFFDIFMLRIKVFKNFKYSYHENTLPWKNISYLGPYPFNYMLPPDIYILVQYVKNNI
jgi:hypothetical protein